ncbi:NAD(+)/NADH kinase [Anaerocolumna xylanovorans]|uniref:NAD kinase n=1 Tax=Anaerocolumna xylanovorans DSM 12503 TaxID=1121345 RepID=A0A1M7YIV9_9FIRM|nr:NAD(+)/NADH kinase [Anaerocolumna xylanovorans]SHO52539.1 NAD+ kinase [Anaerocolumna xylanovorans DSM 12503]
MNKFCLITNRNKDADLELTNEIIKYMTLHQKDCVCIDREENYEKNGSSAIKDKIGKDTDCILVLGGDGTIIQAADIVCSLEVPILGINLGTLGFLADIERNQVWTALDSLFADNYSIEERIMLRGVLINNQEQEDLGVALNDIVISRSNFSKIINISIYINDELADSYRGDGVIVSTPTGSTGYSLSSGGPVVKPDADILVLSPICPHTLGARSIVISPNDSVRIQINENKVSNQEGAVAVLDGKLVKELTAGDSIRIAKASEKTRMVKVNHVEFFEVLRKKIGQGGEKR